ncbi:hypothetical protein KAU11_10775 [Candidatus Babeliales bacterium]|nr:hypothetical protein [Candidatus Babeliales bacterium]
MKKCPTCSLTKEDTEFYKDSRAKTGLASACKPCHLKLSKKFGKVMRIKWQEYIDDILKPECTKCGYSKCKRALDYHHLDSTEKSFGIAQFVWKRGFTENNKEQMLKELDKCIVLCSNCHRELHDEAI